MANPEVEQWVAKVNENKAGHVGVSPRGVADGYAAGGETDRQRIGESPSTGVADGDAGGGRSTKLTSWRCTRHQE